MIRNITILSLLTSIVLFVFGISWGAIIPLLISMYLIFTDGHIQLQETTWQFSRYHILFLLRCTIIVGLSLLFYVFGISLLNIICILIGFHMVIIWATLLGHYKDEFTMFHIGYYFVMCIALRYIPMAYGFRLGSIARLLFPVITFLLYAGGTFFIEPFVRVGIKRHYRTAIFFIVSFLSSIILYFFSIPLVGWASALILYGCIVGFVVHQYQSFIIHEKRKNVLAEDILAGHRVIQPADGIRHHAQSVIHRITKDLPTQWRTLLVLCSGVFMGGTLISAFTTSNTFDLRITFLILCIAMIVYYLSNEKRHSITYPTAGSDSITGVFLHGIFLWTLWAYSADNLITIVFLTMGWTILHHGISIFLASQAKFRHNQRKYALLYGYSASTGALGIGVLYLFTQLGLQNTFVRAISLLYIGIIGSMIYFFSRAWQK